MGDQRKFERFGVKIPAKIEIMSPRGPKKKIEMETENLSATGTFFRMAAPLPKGIPVKIEIVFHFDELKAPDNIDGALILQITGRTLRSGSDGLAICFDEESASFMAQASGPACGG